MALNREKMILGWGFLIGDEWALSLIFNEIIYYSSSRPMVGRKNVAIPIISLPTKPLKTKAQTPQ
jgi:hypothetical protein